MSEEKTAHILIRDFFGVVALAFTVFGLMALMTFSSTDPTFNKSVSEGNVINSGGLVGAYLADGLVLIFGSGSFFVPVITAVIGWILIRGKDTQNWSLVLGSGVLFLVGLCSLMAIQFATDPFFEKVVPVGGLIGDVLGGFLVTWLNPSGAVLTLLTLIFISFMVMTRLEVNTLVQMLGKIFTVVGSGLWSAINGAKAVILKTFQAATRIFKGMETAFEKLQSVRAGLVKTKKVESNPVIVTRTRPEPLVIERKDKPDTKKKEEKPEFVVQDHFSFMGTSSHYEVPSLTLLNDVPPDIGTDVEKARNEILASSAILEKKLSDFGIEGRVVQVLPGPVITLFEYEPAPGVKVNKIVGLTDDLAMALRAISIRIIAPLPGKSVVGIEIPNPSRETVYLRTVLESDGFRKSPSEITVAMGKDIFGNAASSDLAKMPHLLVAGSTGTGKSVFLNSFLCSLLCRATPDELKLLLVDPKLLELSIYQGIPHLIADVVTDPKRAAAALKGIVRKMEERYLMMSSVQVRNVAQFNTKAREQIEAGNKFFEIKTRSADGEEVVEEMAWATMPYIVVVIDELADLMVMAAKDVEESLQRLAQMARAAGIHLVLATQRPSVDVLTGVIKANFPSRVSFQVSSATDSRTILDQKGAENLLGLGDMLFLAPRTALVERLHGCFVSESEVVELVEFLREQGKPVFDEELVKFTRESAEGLDPAADEEADEMFDQAVSVVAESRNASISYVQRRLKVGYNRAARMVEQMERDGMIGPQVGIRSREVFLRDPSEE